MGSGRRLRHLYCLRGDATACSVLRDARSFRAASEPTAEPTTADAMGMRTCGSAGTRQGSKARGEQAHLQGSRPPRALPAALLCIAEGQRADAAACYAPADALQLRPRASACAALPSAARAATADGADPAKAVLRSDCRVTCHMFFTVLASSRS